MKTLALPEINLEENAQNPDFPSEYTYHRHSEEKSMIYFRCSDKNCKARVLFSKETCNFTLKNRHLSPSKHKPNSRRAITGQQMAKLASLIKGPISLTDSLNDPTFYCESLALSVRSEEVEKKPKEECLLRVTCETREDGEKLCKELVSCTTAKKAHLWTLDSDNSSVVEVKCSPSKAESLLSILSQHPLARKLESFNRI